MGLKKFNTYLDEVRKPIPNTDFASNIKQLEYAVKARVGKFTRLGYEPLALAKLGQGMGLTYLFNSPFDKAFRVIYAANPNYNGRPTVVAINVWNHLRYLPSGETSVPDVSIELGQYDMFDPKDFEIIINTLVGVIQNPKSGIYQAENYITESSRHVTMDEFYTIVSRELNDPNVDIIDIQTLNAIANKHGVGIPTAVRTSTKGANSRSLKTALEKAKVYVKKGTSSTTGEVKALGYMSVATKLRQLGASPEEIVYETEYAVKSLTDALQRGAGTSLIIAGKGGVGKCFAKGTKILMYDGSLKNVEDITENELVMGNDSTPRTVYGVTSGKEEMFDIIPVKGEKFTVNKSHILSLKYNGKVINISVEDYLKETSNFKKNSVLYRTDIDFSNSPIKLDPYFLGLWLGDGTSNRTEITNVDSEVIKYLNEYALSIGYKLTEWYKDSNRTSQWNITKNNRDSRNGHIILDELRRLNLINNKHIPKEYLVNSNEIRLKVLAGLIDSDGNYNVKSNCYEISQKNIELANNILYLARSLGLAAYNKCQFKTCQTGNGDYYNRIIISGDIDKIPVKIKRKIARKRKQIKNVLHTGFEIKSVGQGEYYGFGVDGNHLFCLADFTVVHNTWLVRKSLKGSEGKNWFTISGRITPLSFYTFLFNHRQHGKVLIFDDIDVFSSEDMLNILKAALENAPDRYVTWDASGRTAPKPHNISELEFYEIKDKEYLQMVDSGDMSKWKPPAKFLFSASIIFITNKPMSEILGNPHLSAVASRALGRVDFDYNDEELIAKMEQVWKQVRPDIPEVTRRAILDLIIAKQRTGALTQLSMRQMTNAFALAGSGKSVKEIAKIIGY